MTAASRIIWNEDEKRAVAAASLDIMCQRAPLVNPTKVDRVAMQNHYGFLTVVIPEAQHQVLPVARHRVISGLHCVPWIYDYVTAASKARIPHHDVAPPLAPAALIPVTPPKQEMPELLELAQLLAPLVAKEVVKQLAEEFELTPKWRTQRPAVAVPVPGGTTVPMARKPQVWMLGLLPNQQREVEATWGKSFRFKFIDAERSTKVDLPSGEWVIGMADFINHSIEARLRKQAGAHYLSVHGGVSSLKKSLNDLNGRLNRKIGA